MILEIRGTSTRNKGAELMLRAITDHYCSGGRRRGGVQFTVDPHFGPFVERAQYGLTSKLRTARWGRSRLVMQLMPLAFRRAYGLVVEEEIDVVLDASGFAYGDQCGEEPTQRLAAAAQAWRRSGKRAVLLPQALGPFTSRPIREAFARVVEHVDLIYARDRLSLDHARDVVGPSDRLRLAPDFTNLVPGVVPAAPPLSGAAAAIVPNYRMIDKTDAKAREAYIPFLAKCVRLLDTRGIETFVLLHDANVDRQLVPHLCEAVGRSLPVATDDDPVRLKGLLATAHLVIGSRFHALVGALSQAVPSIACGWSHKYQMLFEDYGCPELVLPVDAPSLAIEEAIDRVCDDAARKCLTDTLRAAAAEQKQQARAMWQEVDALLGLSDAEAVAGVAAEA